MISKINPVNKVQYFQKDNNFRSKNFMKQFVIITNSKMVETLEKMGFLSCGEREMENGVVATQFLLSDKLKSVLKDNQMFSKNSYIIDSRLTF